MAKKKPPRLFTPLSVDYWTDGSLALSIDENPMCEVMWTRLLCVTKRAEMDGFVPLGDVVAAGVRHWRKLMGILIKNGLVVEGEGGFSLPGWLNWNLSNDDIAQERKKRAENVANYRARLDLEKSKSVSAGHSAKTPESNHDVTGNSTIALPVTEGHNATKQEAGSRKQEDLSVLVIKPNQEPETGLEPTLPATAEASEATTAATDAEVGPAGRKRNLPWEAAHEALLAEWPGVSAETASEWAGACKKKADATKARRRVVLVSHILRLHGVKDLAVVPSPTRTALMSRIDAAVALEGGPGRWAASWAHASTSGFWPTGITGRLDRVIELWLATPRPKQADPTVPTEHFDWLPEPTAAQIPETKTA